jgi:hypothetical protein
MWQKKALFVRYRTDPFRLLKHPVSVCNASEIKPERTGMKKEHQKTEH